ncbi:hypothetical protein B0H17DRAFT_1194524 [Mycena rosella]|uniref:Uncharacterized protein n=1 Tax=Mycena rosella TaxID=1033263 RepID=A0AAD7GQ62_MYCRO|nr:hypothetical protein B0H17DRAFT_1194524 [Mycena rosella]
MNKYYLDTAYEGMIQFAWPAQFGYRVPQRSREAAVAVTMRARNAFLPLMATITMMFVLFNRFADISWRIFVIESCWCHPQWFADLESSAVGNMKTERIGGIIDSRFPDDSPLVWKHPMGQLLSQPTSPPLAPASPDRPVGNPAKDVGQKFPPVERHSGQREGEGLHAFFAHRKTQNEKWMEKETPAARSKRFAREANAAKGVAPSKKGAQVFVWEEQDSFFIHTATSRESPADMWDEFTSNQRLYDGFSDQWDLCVALAPEKEAELHDDDTNDYVDPPQALTEPNIEFHNIPGIPDGLLPEEEIGQHSTADDLRGAYNLDDKMPDDDEPYEACHDMTEVPYSRFGFTEPIAPAQYQENVRDNFCARSVGDEEWPDLKHAKYELLPALLAYLVKAKFLEDIPRELIDLRQDEADISDVWAVKVERKLLNTQPFYFIRPRGLSEENRPLSLLLQSAATTLQIVRMDWGSDFGVQEIAFHLLARASKRTGYASPRLQAHISRL